MIRGETRVPPVPPLTAARIFQALQDGQFPWVKRARDRVMQNTVNIPLLGSNKLCNPLPRIWRDRYSLYMGHLRVWKVKLVIREI